MKKNFVNLLLAVCMIFTVILPVTASEYLPLYDEADLLTDSEESALIAKLESVGAQYQMEVVVAAFETIGDYTPMEYADDFYDYNGYGYGENRDGLILIVAMDTSDWWISTRGEAIRTFTDAGIEYIGEQIVPYMSYGDFYSAFNEFADQCSTFMAQAQTGDPFDYHNLPEAPKAPFNAGTALLVSLGLGLVIAAIYTGSLKGQLKSVKAQRAAASYVKNGSMNVTNSRDFFLYRNVTRTARETSSGGKGGSSTHRSSSGATHGGGGGKF
ncbi:MAG: TPM domain-containing protein [Ruminococcaceae bacterium]|nr:TPM domain-containing protein [Oscillospiraceae bacterium]